MKPEDVIAGKGRPFTGQEYMESLRDEREVYIYGERVADVTTHPAFRNSVRSIAKLYDALHDPKHKDVLTCPTDGGNGGFTHKFFRVATLARGPDCAARGDRRLGAHVLRLDGAHARLQGVADEYARRAVRFLRKIRRQRQGLVPPRTGQRPVHEPRDRQSAGRPQQGAGAGARRVHHDPEGDRRRLLRLGRQGGGDLLGDYALQFRRAERRDAGERS